MNFIVLFLLLHTINGNPNNVCKEFWQYKFKHINSNCWYNKDAEERTDNIIKNHGFSVEQYETVTEDLFILTVFRIPPKDQNNVKGIVYLQHPALASSSVWVSHGNNSLAFSLAHNGYDVWMGNFRATSYSEKHKVLKKDVSRTQYWNHSLHEFGLYDVPAQIKLIREKTDNREKIIYIGHSVGTSSALVYSTLKPEEAEENVRLFVLLAPIASLGNTRTPLRAIIPFADLFQEVLKVFKIEGISFNGALHKAVKHICLSIPSFISQCSLMVDITVGPQFQDGNPVTFPAFLYQSFEGFSIKAIMHFIQLVRSNDRFQMYDYGSKQNQIYYNNKYPPEYPLHKIKVPIRLVYGGNDYFSTEKDSYILYNKLPSNVRYGIEQIDAYEHFDFHYGKDLDTLLVKPILEYLSTIK